MSIFRIEVNVHAKEIAIFDPVDCRALEGINKLAKEICGKDAIIDLQRAHELKATLFIRGVK